MYFLSKKPSRTPSQKSWGGCDPLGLTPMSYFLSVKPCFQSTLLLPFLFSHSNFSFFWSLSSALSPHLFLILFLLLQPFNSNLTSINFSIYKAQFYNEEIVQVVLHFFLLVFSSPFIHIPKFAIFSNDSPLISQTDLTETVLLSGSFCLSVCFVVLVSISGSGFVTIQCIEKLFNERRTDSSG